MFGRKKQDDDFDWHKHGRTKALLRRKDRYKRLKSIQLWGLEKLRGISTFALSLSSLLMSTSMAFFGNLLRYAWLVLKWAGIGLRSCLSWCRRYLSSMAGHSISSFLTQPGVAPLLGLMCLVTAGSTIARIVTVGWDFHTIIAACFAGLFLLLTLAAALFYVLPSANWMASFKIPRPGNFSAASLTAAIAITIVLATAATGAVIIYTTPASSWFEETWLEARWLETSWFEATWTDPPGNPDCEIPQSPEFVEGVAKAITGDTLQIDNVTVKLAGIDAPELLQRCSNSRGRRWRCGRVAQRSLARLTGYKLVKCKILNHNRRSYIKSGYCSIDGADIGESLVKAGRVFAADGVYGRYGSVENKAQQEKAGIWGGKAQSPQAYRDAAFKLAKDRAPDGCPIKGHVSAAIGKRYLMPWSPGYQRERVRKQQGERWFCNEEEAIAACWKTDPAS